jgi:hypothetical protein
MALLETSLSASYQTSWKPCDALREIIANAIDAQERDGHVMKMTFKDGKLTVISQGAKVPTSALLMGVSESRKFDKAIGEFGEGLPMALLTLVRWGHDVSIVNDDEKWEALLHHSEVYGENILAVKTRQLRKSHGLFKVEVNGIPDYCYEEARNLFLQYHEDYDPTQRIGDGESSILLQPAMKGMVFNKGVFVMKHPELMFGYNLHTTLNRDRSIIDTWKLREVIDLLMTRTVENATPDELRSIAEAFIVNPDALEGQTGYSDLSENDKVLSAVLDIWVEKHGDALPVYDRVTANEAEQLGVDTVMTSRVLCDTLGRSSKYNVNQVTQAAMRKPTVVHSFQALVKTEIDNLKHARNLLLPVRRVQGQLQIVDFASDSISSSFDREDRKYFISREALQTRSTTILALGRAICDAHGEGRSDSRVLNLIVSALGGE